MLNSAGSAGKGVGVESDCGAEVSEDVSIGLHADINADNIATITTNSKIFFMIPP